MIIQGLPFPLLHAFFPPFRFYSLPAFSSILLSPSFLLFLIGFCCTGQASLELSASDLQWLGSEQSTVTSSSCTNFIIASAIRQEKERRHIDLGRCQTVFVDVITISIEKSQEPMKML